MLGVVLVPGAIYVAGARISRHLIAMLLHVGEGFGVRLVETLIRPHLPHAQGLMNGRQTLELYYAAILAHLFHLFAILDVDVCGTMLFSMLYGKAISRGRGLCNIRNSAIFQQKQKKQMPLCYKMQHRGIPAYLKYFLLLCCQRIRLV